MTIPKEAIERAIQGGYTKSDAVNSDWALRLPSELHGMIALDPSFWKALGEVLGWAEEDELIRSCWRLSGGGSYMPEGLYHWHKTATRFCELILRRADTAEFWERLLHPPHSVTD